MACISDVPLLIIFGTHETQCAKVLMKCSVQSVRVACISDVPLLIIFGTHDTQCAKILIRCSVNEIVSIMVFELTNY